MHHASVFGSLACPLSFENLMVMFEQINFFTYDNCMSFKSFQLAADYLVRICQLLKALVFRMLNE